MKQYATLEDTVYFWFAGNDTSGSGGDGASPAADVRLAGAAADAAPVFSPVPALLTDAGYPDGCYELAVAATVGNGCAANNTYAVFCTLAIDSQNPTGFVGSFDLKPILANAKQIEGGDATNAIRDAVVDDATRIDASALNTLSGHDPGATICADGTPLTTGETESEVNNALVALDLDHLINTSVADEVADDSIIAKLVSKDATADWSGFVNTTDSLQAIRDAIVASNPQNHAATANNESGNTTLDGGGFAETATDNADYYDTGPGADPGSGFGLDCQLTYGIGTGRIVSSVIVNGRFVSGALRTVQVWAYDYIVGDYIQLSNSATDFGHSAVNDSTYQYALTTNMVNVASGEVKIRFTSTSVTGTDVWKCDYVNVSSVAQEAAGLTADAIQHAVWERTDNHIDHDRETLGHALSTLHTVDGLVVSATDATQFIIDTGVANNEAFNGNAIVIMDISDNHHEMRRIVDYIGNTKEVFVDRAFSFTPATGDYVHISGASYADVNVTHVGGTAQTGRDIGANVLLSSGSGTGQLDFTSGVVKSNLVQILGTALTETGGYIAAAFKKLFNVASPTLVASDVMRGTDIGNMHDFDSANDDVAKVTALDSAYDAAKSAAQAGDDMNLANDAIKAAKYDESTAYPIKSADTGGSKIARVGADSDTLETLSGQIDGCNTTTPPTVTEIQAEMEEDGASILDTLRDLVTAARMGVLTDWINEGRLDNLLDAIPTTAMRGTDGANTTTPPTVTEIQAEMEENGASLLDTIRDIASNGTYGNSALQVLVAALQTDLDNGTDGLGALKTLIDELNDISVANVTGAEVDNDGTAISLAGFCKLVLSVLTGKSSGGGTTAIVFRDINDSKDRISATVDVSGNRDAIGTRDAS